MNKITEQQQQQIPLLPPNGDICCITKKKEEYDEEQEIIQARIDELEQELIRLRLQLSISDKT